ncbi:MAG TPA: hypothetical protein VFX49_03115 [Chloroflexota bacterium]|nr:hypothetical protein [Chloroflexota bacterium]
MATLQSTAARVAPGRRLEGSLTGPAQRPRAYVVGLAALAAVGGFIFLLTSPTQALLGESAWALNSALHGLGAGVLMIGVTVGLFQAYRLYRGDSISIGEMQIGSLFTAAASLVTIFYGNWIYIAYRASAPTSPRSYFLENMPQVHQVFFEFKEFLALYTLPLAVGAAFMIWYYGDQLRTRPAIRNAVAVTLVLAFFYFAVAFGLGAAVTKLRAV